MADKLSKESVAYLGGPIVKAVLDKVKSSPAAKAELELEVAGLMESAIENSSKKLSVGAVIEHSLRNLSLNLPALSRFLHDWMEVILEDSFNNASVSVGVEHVHPSIDNNNSIKVEARFVGVEVDKDTQYPDQSDLWHSKMKTLLERWGADIVPSGVRWRMGTARSWGDDRQLYVLYEFSATFKARPEAAALYVLGQESLEKLAFSALARSES